MNSTNYSTPWYHGSPYELTTIRKESTITQNRNLARIFSHKPSCVSIGDDGDIKHNGMIEGYLYIIDESIGENDIYAHPRTTMQTGIEWLIRRDLKVKLIERTVIIEDEKLGAVELKKMKKILPV